MTQPPITPERLPSAPSPYKLEIVDGAEFGEQGRADSKQFYLDAYAATTTGPQLEGLSPAALDTWLEQPEGVALKVPTPEGVIYWPVLAPAKITDEHNMGFFARRYPEYRQVYYFSDPTAISEALGNVDPASRQAMLDHLQAERALVVFDYKNEDTETRQASVRRFFGDFEVIDFVDSHNNTPAEVIHFGGKAERTSPPEIAPRTVQEAIDHQFATGALERLPRDGLTIVRPEDLSQQLDDSGKTVGEQIWDVYQGQFVDVTADHPAREWQRQEELLGMLADPQTIAAAYLEEGKVVSLCYFVQNIQACDWLNPDFYEQAFPDEVLMYFPGIVTDVKKQGQRHAQKVVDLLIRTTDDIGQDLRIVFQCSNVSVDYIPYKVVQPVVNASGYFTIQVQPLTTYHYQGLVPPGGADER